MTETLDFGALPRRGQALAFVLVVHGPDGGRYPIDGTILVGKHPENDVVIDAPGVSRYHLEVRAEADTVVVRDVGSKNGTFANGARITEIRVGVGSVVRIGGPAGTELGIELTHQPAIQPSSADRFGPLIGRCSAMRSVFTVLERTAPSAATLLVLGETGTGKEVCAQAVHEASPRRAGPLVVIDCGAIPHHLIESELFGHRRGAFTGADGDRVGAFEAASGGTLFLDEVGELPLELQPKLLRAIQEREIRAVGATKSEQVDVRIVAATHRHLAEKARAGEFRQDLYARLALWELAVPSVRERKVDIPRWIQFLHEVWLRERKLPADVGLELHPDALEVLLAASWPENLRGLNRFVHELATRPGHEVLRKDQIPAWVRA